MTNSIMTKTAIAIATVLTLGSATVALANDIDESGSAAQVTREWNQYLNQKGPSHLNSARAAYGFVQDSVPQAHESRYDRSDDR